MALVQGEEGEGIITSEPKSETAVPENKNDLERSIPSAKNECPLPPKAPVNVNYNILFNIH